MSNEKPFKLPILKYFLIWQFGASLGLLLLNLLIYGTAGEPSVIGLILVYSEYFGSFLGASFLIFFPSLIYRLIIKFRNRLYSRKSDLNWLIAGIFLMVLSISGTIGRL